MHEESILINFEKAFWFQFHGILLLYTKEKTGILRIL